MHVHNYSTLHVYSSHVHVKVHVIVNSGMLWLHVYCTCRACLHVVYMYMYHTCCMFTCEPHYGDLVMTTRYVLSRMV